jgi:hypothetical protein
MGLSTLGNAARAGGAPVPDDEQRPGL